MYKKAKTSINNTYTKKKIETFPVLENRCKHALKQHVTLGEKLVLTIG